MKNRNVKVQHFGTNDMYDNVIDKVRRIDISENKEKGVDEFAVQEIQSTNVFKKWQIEHLGIKYHFAVFNALVLKFSEEKVVKSKLEFNIEYNIQSLKTSELINRDTPTVDDYQIILKHNRFNTMCVLMEIDEALPDEEFSVVFRKFTEMMSQVSVQKDVKRNLKKDFYDFFSEMEENDFYFYNSTLNDVFKGLAEELLT